MNAFSRLLRGTLLTLAAITAWLIIPDRVLANSDVELCQVPTIIRGTLIDQYGDPVTVGKIRVYFEMWPGADPVTYGAFNVNPNGTYVAQLLPGQHYNADCMLIYSDGYVSATERIMTQTYPTGSELREATRIPFLCGDTITANFVLKRIRQYNVSGRVTRKADSTPVAGAEVRFFTRGQQTYPMTIVTTASDGSYSLGLWDHFTYTVQAIAKNDATLLSQFYNRAANPIEATSITLTGNRTDIDFALPAVFRYNNGLSGVVRDTAGNPVKAFVTAISLAGNYAWADTDNDGAYSLSDMVPDDYYLFALPRTVSFLPGYYTLNGQPSMSIMLASPVTVAGSVLTGSYDIVLRSSGRSTGRANLRGVISSDAGKAHKDGASLAGSMPIAGATVVILDHNNQPLTFALTDQNGEFTLSDLASGDMRILVDKPGFEPHESSLILTDGRSDVAITLESATTSSVSDNGMSASAALRIFPNPAIDRLTLSLSGMPEGAVITLVSTVGIEVYSAEIEQGETAHVIGTSGIPAGLYLLRVSGTNGTVTMPVSIVH